MDLFDIFEFFGDAVGCIIASIIVLVLLLICAACVFGLLLARGVG